MRLCAIVTCVFVVLLCAARANAASAGENAAAIAVVERDGGGATVLYIEGGTPPVMHAIYELGERPIAWTSTPDEVVMVFAATAGKDVAAVHPVRRVKMVRDAWDVVSPGELEPMTPIAAFDGRAAVGIAGEEIFALVGIGAASKKLLRHDGDGWTGVASPIVGARPWDGVIGLGLAAALTWANGSELVVQPIGGGEEAGEMLRAATDVPVRVMSVGRQVIAMSLPVALTGAAYAGEAKLWLLRPGQLVNLATVTEVRSGSQAIAYGDDALMLMAVDASGQQLDAVVVGLDGQVQYRGAVGTAHLLASAELQILLLMLGSVGLTVLLYVLRRDAVVHAPTRFPTGMALADSLRRLMAATMDGSMSIVVVAILWPGDINLMTAPLEAVVTKLGVWPLVAAMGLTAAHMGITEAMLGTTLGKAVLGCRTVDRLGKPVDVARAFGRSAAKAFCPLLALFVMANPTLPHPGAFGTYTVLRERAQEEGDEQGQPRR